MAASIGCVKPRFSRNALTCGPMMFRGGFMFRFRNLTVAVRVAVMVLNSERLRAN